MGSSRVEASLYALLRQGLWGRGDNGGMDFSSLSPSEWTSVHDAAHHQTVLAVTASALAGLPDAQLPPDSLLLRWAAEADRLEHHAGAMNRKVAALCAWLEGEGLQPVVLKGQGVAQLYADPSLREAGDIDLYFPRAADRAAAELLLEASGVSLERLADGSSCGHWQGAEVELHPRLFDLASPKAQPLLQDFERRFGFTWQPLPTGESIRVPSPPLCLLLLSTHILKHAMGHGVGLRQLCDMTRALSAWRGAAGADDFARMTARLGLARWTRLLCAFLVGRLGLDAACAPLGVAPGFRPLERIVLEGGNFGFLRRKTAASSVWRRKAATARAFLAHTGFSLRYAPGEALCTFLGLMGGQAKC